MKIWTNYLDEAALSKTGIEVYYHAYDTPPVDYFEKAATISTDGSGNASGSFNLGKYNGTDGKNASAINIQYADSETITFIFGSYSGTFTIDQVGNGKVINLTK